MHHQEDNTPRFTTENDLIVFPWTDLHHGTSWDIYAHWGGQRFDYTYRTKLKIFAEYLIHVSQIQGWKLEKWAKQLLLGPQTKPPRFSAVPEQVLTSERPHHRYGWGFESKLNHEERSHCIPSHNEALNLVSRPPSFLKQKISQKVPSGDLFWSHHTVVSFLHFSSCFSSHTGGPARRKRTPPPRAACVKRSAQSLFRGGDALPLVWIKYLLNTWIQHVDWDLGVKVRETRWLRRL